MGKAYVHTIINDHSRIAYAEIHDNEATFTTTAVLIRAVSLPIHQRHPLGCVVGATGYAEC